MADLRPKELDALLDEEARRWRAEENDPELVRQRLWGTFAARYLSPLAILCAATLTLLILVGMVRGWSGNPWLSVDLYPLFTALLFVLFLTPYVAYRTVVQYRIYRGASAAAFARAGRAGP